MTIVNKNLPQTPVTEASAAASRTASTQNATAAIYPSAIARIDRVDINIEEMQASILITFIGTRSNKPHNPPIMSLEMGNLYDWDMTPETAAELLPAVGSYHRIEYDPTDPTDPQLVGWDKDAITPDLEGNASQKRAAWIKEAISDDDDAAMDAAFRAAESDNDSEPNDADEDDDDDDDEDVYIPHRHVATYRHAKSQTRYRLSRGNRGYELELAVKGRIISDHLFKTRAEAEAFIKSHKEGS